MAASLTHAFKEKSLAAGLDRLSQAFAEGPPPVLDILHAAAASLGIELTPQHRGQLEAIAAIAETDHKGTYHNPIHFREVVACTAVLMQHTSGALNEDQKYLLLVAAAVHDINHDGTGNKIDGQHVPFRLEDISFASVAPYLRLRGMDDAKIKDLHALLRATDVSMGGPGQPSPAARLRDGDFSNGLERYQDRPDLQGMAMILQAADIMPSSAISQQHSRASSERLEQENGTPATAQSFAWFAENIARGALENVPDIGAQLAARMDGIRAAALRP